MTTATLTPAPVPLAVLPTATAAAAQCCPALRCAFSPGRVHQYLQCIEVAMNIGEDPAAIIRDWQVEHAGEVSLVTSRATLGPTSWRASDIVVSLLRAAKEGGIPLTAWNARKIAQFLCPYATLEGE